MKIFELLEQNNDQELDVKSVTSREVHLQDPKTGIKTIVPKDPNKPGAISSNDNGEFEVDPSLDHGKVDNKIKPGTKVKVKQPSNSQPGQHSKSTRPSTAPGSNVNQQSGNIG